VIKSKKSQATTFSWVEVIKIIFTFLIIVGLFIPVGLKLYSMFFADDKDTVTNFNALADTIELMLQRPAMFEYSEIMMYIEEPYNIQGFDGILDGRLTELDPAAPSKCKNNYPCICLYKEDKPRRCRTFEPKTGVIIYGNEAVLLTGRMKTDPNEHNSVDNIPEFYNFEFAMWYAPLQLFFTEDKKIFEQVYVEKVVHKDGDKDINYIMVGVRLSEWVKYERFKFLSICPPDFSDPECNNARVNSEVKDGFCHLDTGSYSLETGESGKCMYLIADHCEINKELTKPCFCGDKYVKEMVFPDFGHYFMTSYGSYQYNSELYCNRDESSGYERIAPFNCDDIKSCSDYCDVISADDNHECGVLEMTFCEERDICNKNCKVKGDKCKNK